MTANHHRDFEELIAHGDDPFQAWIQYLTWCDDHVDAESKEPVYRKFTQFVTGEKRLYNDSRAVKLFLKYVNLVQDPMKVIRFMLKKQIGKEVPVFYAAWAQLTFNKSGFEAGLQIFKEAYKYPCFKEPDRKERLTYRVKQYVERNDPSHNSQSRKRSRAEYEADRGQLTSPVVASSPDIMTPSQTFLNRNPCLSSSSGSSKYSGSVDLNRSVERRPVSQSQMPSPYHQPPSPLHRISSPYKQNSPYLNRFMASPQQNSQATDLNNSVVMTIQGKSYVCFPQEQAPVYTSPNLPFSPKSHPPETSNSQFPPNRRPSSGGKSSTGSTGPYPPSKNPLQITPLGDPQDIGRGRVAKTLYASDMLLDDSGKECISFEERRSQNPKYFYQEPIDSDGEDMQFTTALGKINVHQPPEPDSDDMELTCTTSKKLVKVNASPDPKRRKLNDSHSSENNFKSIFSFDENEDVRIENQSRPARKENVYPPSGSSPVKSNPFRRSSFLLQAERQQPSPEHETDSWHPPPFEDPLDSKTFPKTQRLNSIGVNFSSQSQEDEQRFKDPLSPTFRERFIKKVTHGWTINYIPKQFRIGNIEPEVDFNIRDDHMVTIESIILQKKHSTIIKCDDIDMDTRTVMKIFQPSDKWESVMRQYLEKICDRTYLDLNFVLVDNMFIFRNCSIGLRPISSNFIISNHSDLQWQPRALINYFLDLLALVEHLHSKNIVCGNIAPNTVGVMSPFHLTPTDSNEISKVILLDFSNSFTTEFLEKTCWVENPELDSNAHKLQHEKHDAEWKPFSLDYFGLRRVLCFWLFRKDIQHVTKELIRDIPHADLWLNVYEKLSEESFELARNALVGYLSEGRYCPKAAKRELSTFEKHLNLLL